MMRAGFMPAPVNGPSAMTMTRAERPMATGARFLPMYTQPIQYQAGRPRHDSALILFNRVNRYNFFLGKLEGCLVPRGRSHANVA